MSSALTSLEGKTSIPGLNLELTASSFIERNWKASKFAIQYTLLQSEPNAGVVIGLSTINKKLRLFSSSFSFFFLGAGGRLYSLYLNSAR